MRARVRYSLLQGHANRQVYRDAFSLTRFAYEHPEHQTPDERNISDVVEAGATTLLERPREGDKVFLPAVGAAKTIRQDDPPRVM